MNKQERDEIIYLVERYVYADILEDGSPVTVLGHFIRELNSFVSECECDTTRATADRKAECQHCIHHGQFQAFCRIADSNVSRTWSCDKFEAPPPEEE